MLRPQQTLVVGNTVTFEVGVRNEGMTASPDFNVRIEAWAGVAPPAPPSFTVTPRFAGLAPGADSRQTVDVTVPMQRPVDVLVRVTADPPTVNSPGGEVWESDENNNVRERTFTIF
ncbi:MAG: CARDB domain-containing protein [Candidatus Rokuibacteriota bacterium]